MSELSMRDRVSEVTVKVEAEHRPPTGMRAVGGETCRCGYWNGEERPGVTRPIGLSGLMWHRAQMTADALAAAGLLGLPEIPAPDDAAIDADLALSGWPHEDGAEYGRGDLRDAFRAGWDSREVAS